MAFVDDSLHFLLISFIANLLKEEQRPVLTIVILVAGVVGGLVVVITVVYFYRFCLKKRPPVTTSGKPEHKRDQIRSQAASQCRPLPLPPVIANQPSFSVPSHYQSCMPQLEPTALQSPDKRTAISIGEPDSADKVAKLFPPDFPVTVTTGVTEKKEPPSYKNDRSSHSKGNYLTVDGIPPRPQSAETMLTVAEDEERRRASLDAYHRHIRRQLPSIEHLEQQQQATYLRGRASSRRHISELPKSAAIALHYPPRKQTSSPLPEVKQHRIYERGHVFSKSWNPERYIYHETPPDVDSDASVPTQIDDYGLDPYKKFYHEMMRVFGSDPRVNELAQESATAVVDRLNIRPFSKQTKSLDDRQPKRRSTVVTPRSLSEAEQRQLVRQQTVFHLQPQNQISRECLNLWADRKMLELNAHLGNQTSTDLSTDQSASTSFESSTEPTAPERRHSSFLELPHSADIRRQKYRSLLLHRQQLSNTMHPQASSFESALSSESSAADSVTVNGVGTASFDSTRSEQTDQHKAPERKLNRQLSESREEKRSPLFLRRECLGRPRPAPYVPLARRVIGQNVAKSLQRDYSIDSKTDRLFKEFVKVDPNFETGPSGRNAGHGRLLPEYNGFGRHRTVDIADVSQHVTIPLICFPEEQTVSR